VKFVTVEIAHESNSFAARGTTYDSFRSSGILRGAEIVTEHRDAGTTMSGFMSGCDRLGIELVPLLYTFPTPSGIIDQEAFHRITDEALELIDCSRPWDGILVGLHGAAVVDSENDAEGHFVEQVRAMAGPSIPIGVACDLHANLSERIVAQSTVVIPYRTNPHLDARQRAEECAELTGAAARGEIRPVQALVKAPLVASAVSLGTGDEPFKSIMQDADAAAARPGMLGASVTQGHPYADVPELGMGFLAIHDGNQEAASNAALWLARRTWARRQDLRALGLDPETALLAAASAPHRPVVLLDTGDNIGGGSPGDSTILLELAQRHGIRRFVQTIFDPEVVAICVAAGVGSQVRVAVGGKTDLLHGRPVHVEGRVRALTDGRFEEAGSSHAGIRYFDAGTTAVLETDHDLTLVISSKLVMPTSVRVLTSAGIVPADYQILVAKGVQSVRPAYEGIAAEILAVATPGVTTIDLTSLLYRNRPRPMFPFEPDTVFRPRVAAVSAHPRT
jgi:microcystin degradation protein MlrC